MSMYRWICVRYRTQRSTIEVVHNAAVFLLLRYLSVVVSRGLWLTISSS